MCFLLQKTLSDITVSKHAKREEELQERMRATEKDLRTKIDEFSDKLSESADELIKLKVIFFKY